MNGITTWDEFLSRSKVPRISLKRKEVLDQYLNRSIEALEGDDIAYFAKFLPQKEHWRLYPLYKETAVFLDIETTGLDFKDRTTVVGLSDIQKSWALVSGLDLTHDTLKDAVKGYGIIVTFNGRSFDIPFLEKEFPKTLWPPVHLDLRYLCKAVGLRGGQKRIEEMLGFRRPDGVMGLTGFDAVRLWRRWEKNRERDALDTLLEYNMEDVENMKGILERIWPILKEGYLAGL